MAGIWGDEVQGSGTQRLARCAVVFEAGDPPRTGWMAFWADPRSGADSGGLPEGIGETSELTVVVAAGGCCPHGACGASAGRDAVPVLSRARRALRAHPAAAFWGAAALVALQLVARGRTLPGVSDGGFDAWRVGPLEPDDVERIRELATWSHVALFGLRKLPHGAMWQFLWRTEQAASTSRTG